MTHRVRLPPCPECLKTPALPAQALPASEFGSYNGRCACPGVRVGTCHLEEDFLPGSEGKQPRGKVGSFLSGRRGRGSPQARGRARIRTTGSLVGTG